MQENKDTGAELDQVMEQGRELSQPAGSGAAQSGSSEPSGASGSVAYEQRQVPTNATSSTSEKVFHEGQSQGDKGYEVSSERISEIVDQTLTTQEPGAVRTEAVKQALSQFSGLDVDTKLAILYYLYEGMGESVTPAAPDAANTELLGGFFDHFNTLPLGDAQLDAMRALVRGDDTPLCNAYARFTENDKLFIWFLLAERMGKDVVGIPENYQLSDTGNQSLEEIKGLDFEQQTTFLRDIAYAMGRSSGE